MGEVLYRLEGHVAVLTLSNPPVNALSHPVRAALRSALERAAADPAVRALVLAGAGGTFVAGADIKEIVSGAVLESPITRELQAQLEALHKPVVAALEGVALGGGLELALACHWRIAGAHCQLGLPEVKLGLIPGAGGTLRFPRLAGAAAALELIPTGTLLGAERALTLGLVDAIADPVLPAALRHAAEAAAAGWPLRRASELTTRIANTSPELFAEFRRKLKLKMRGQLAPGRAVDAIEAACLGEKEEALRLERQFFLECRASPQHRALVHVFFAEREARRIPDVPAELTARPVRRAGVVGAGTMGSGIATCFARAGIPVVLLDASASALARGLETLRRNLESAAARGTLAAGEVASALERVRPAHGPEALAEADLIVEAVVEDLAVKREVFARADACAAPHAILASNTSTLDIDALAASTRRPQQVLGLHFFSPAHVMRLLEVVRGAQTAPATLATAMALGRTLGKVTVLAGNCDGFIGNRMLGYYGREAEYLLEEGATPAQIDRVIEAFGFAMGPLAVRDLAGNDVGWAIRQQRRLPSGERYSPILERLVQQGRLGQKSGRGFYRYEGRARQEDPQVMELIESVSRELGIARRPIPDEEILDRLLHPLVNEGARVLEEGVALRSGDIDVVYVNGYGFPAWRGGPMYWAAQQGLERVVRTTEALARTHGARWGPAPLLLRSAAGGKGWAL
ncbi:MAG: enoyl-CoA hydratase/isomerase family protein [Gammaproteobacteria bacterium]|nr:enoyl-CoA hydratase/isomerase family protein [Gammaproteobacteria bacterium]